MAKIDELFRMMAEHGASDLHLISGQPPALRINGELERITGQAVLTQDTLHPLLHEILPESKKDQFESTGDVDFGYEIPGSPDFVPTSSIINTASGRCSGRSPARF